MQKPLLEVKDLCINISSTRGNYDLTDRISFDVLPGETFGLVGESGCGKSITALSIMRLISYPLLIKSGEILLDGEDLLKKPEKEMRKVRGKEISMIFQEPMTSLDPIFTVQDQLLEILQIHRKMKQDEMIEKITSILELVGIPRIKDVLLSYPHQLSGGMLQRVMIAMAMMLDPRLLIADEPTTALDVTIQAQILALMNDLKEHFDTSIIIITHDLGVVAETCRRVAVLYAGQIVEQGSSIDIFHNPLHPYTRGLLRSMKTLGSKEKLYSIKGSVPGMGDIGKGCRFFARCDYADEKCTGEQVLTEISPAHICRCYKAGSL
ncbi:MAG: ABC transporter ATP-binding protein [Treponema sp.]|nr:ABC transporter ATP-binding protein [Treponema sp.]